MKISIGALETSQYKNLGLDTPSEKLNLIAMVRINRNGIGKEKTFLLPW